MEERPKVRRSPAAIGFTLLASTWLDDLLRWLGAIGDAKEVGRLILGVPPEFLWLVLQWAAATAGFGLLVVAFAEPGVYLAKRWAINRQRRERFAEVFPWILGEQYRTLELLSGSPLMIKASPRPPLSEFLIHVTSTSIAGVQGEVWKLHPAVAPLARRLLAKRRAGEEPSPPAGQPPPTDPAPAPPSSRESSE